MAGNAETDSPSSFQGLIDSLREKAVEEADAKADGILAAAEKRATEILNRARAEADQIVTEAQREAETLQTSVQDALRRASRDVLLSLESEVTAQLDAVMHRETRSLMHGEVLATMVRSVVEKWSLDSEAGGVEVLLSESDLAALEEAGWHGLKDRLLEGVEFRPVPDVEAGFRIGHKDGTVHYDFTARTLAEWMGRFVTPRVRTILREVSAGQD